MIESAFQFIYLIILFLFYVSNEGRWWTEQSAVEEVSQARAEAAFVGGRRLSRGSNEWWKWERAEEVSIGPWAEAISGGNNAGGGDRRARDEEAAGSGGYEWGE